jgi:HK97 family phage prohead protease
MKGRNSAAFFFCEVTNMKVDRYGCGLLEVKFSDSGNESKVGKFSGYGSIFGNIDGGGDVIEKGAFKETLAEWEAKGKYPPMLLQHGGFWGNADDLLPIGKWTKMEENTKGLKVEGELFALNTERGQYIYEGMKAGALDGMSIGYRAKTVRLGSKPEEPRRTLTAVDLVELSVVTFPMNDKARIGAVKSIEELQNLSDAESYLREVAGLSQRQAVAFVSRIKSLRPSDSESSINADIARLNDRIKRLTSGVAAS